jgi:hypothetical protein
MDSKINNSFYECKRCFHKFYQKNDMKKHLEKKNLCERTVESYKYKNEDLYKLSLERIYNTEKTHLCKNCNKNFYNNANLKRHIEKYCKKNNNDNSSIDENIIESLPIDASPIIEKQKDIEQNGNSNINNISNSTITNNSNNNINININITRSFDDDWDTSKIDINKKILLLIENSKFTKTLENILENEVNLNVLIDTNADNGLVYNNKEFTKMNAKDIVKKTMSKLHKHLIEFYDDIVKNSMDKPYKGKIEYDKPFQDYLVSNLTNINNKYSDFNNSKDIQKTVKEYITNIYDKKNIDTLNYIHNNNGY